MFLSVTEAEGGTTKPCFASDREDAMDNSKTPKIVVGIGLAAVYSGLAFYFLRDTGGNITPNAMTAPPAEIAAAPVPPPAAAPSSTDILPSVTEQPTAATEVPAA